MPRTLAALLERPMSQRRLMRQFNLQVEPGDRVAVELELAELLAGLTAVVELEQSGVVLLTRVRAL